MNIETRAKILANYGATRAEIEELLAYNENVFSLADRPPFPLEPEPHVAAWREYLAQSRELGVFPVLRERLVQLQFPIAPGISETGEYRQATRKGQPTGGMALATGLILKEPESLQLIIHESAAGEIPVIIAGCREDFVSLVQGLTKRNEPHPIPDSMGATMVSGFNNWDRIRQYRASWEAHQTEPVSESAWQWEFKRLIRQKHLYQDRLIILSRGNYSAVSAGDMGMDESTWHESSLTIRLSHECTHYFTRRLFGFMRNNLLDELIADYQGIVAANGGRYRADWFLRFVGLESFPDYRPGGRLENYRGEPPLSEGGFNILQGLVKDAADNLQGFNVIHQQELARGDRGAKLLMALTCLTLEELADRQHNWLELTWQEMIG